MKHKQAMAALQTRIASMQSQLLIGGQKIEDTLQFRHEGSCHDLEPRVWLAGVGGRQKIEDTLQFSCGCQEGSYPQGW